MTPDINQYIRYCLFLFDNCTVNGLGTFEVNQIPPVPDHHGNLIKAEKYSISFTTQHTERNRLAYLISTKENCSEEDAENYIIKYVQNVFSELNTKNEIWLRELGVLVKKDGEVRFMSHKFTAKDLKKQVNSTPLTENEEEPVKNVSSNKPVVSVTPVIDIETLILPSKEETLRLEEEKKIIEEPIKNDVEKIVAKPTLATVVSTAQKKEDVSTAPASNTVTTTLPSVVNKIKEEFTFPKNFVLFKTNNQKMIAASIAGLMLLVYVLYSFVSSDKNNTQNLSATIGNTVVKDANDINSQNTSLDIPNDANNILPANKKKITADNIKEQELKNAAATQNTPANQQKAVTEEETGTDNTLNPEKNNITDRQNFMPAAIETDLQSTKTEKDIIRPSVNNLAPPQRELAVNNEQKANAAQNDAAFKEPEFPGGKEKLSKFLRKNLSYPESAIEDEVQGICVVRLHVNKEGSITNTVIANSLGNDFDKEIKRLISKLPKFTPGTQNGEPTESVLSLKLNFQYQGKTQQK
jgi:TonB family protein